MREDNVMLFFQNYLSKLVSYNDDDNLFYLFSYVEKYFSQGEKESLQMTVDIYYRLISIGLISIQVDGERTIRENVRDLIDYIEGVDSWDGWFLYFKPTDYACSLINKFDLYDNYYNENEIHLGFSVELNELFSNNDISLNIYPLVNIGFGGKIELE